MPDLSKDVTEADLIEAFAAWPVTEARIPRHPVTRSSHGYGYVSFQSMDAGASPLRSAGLVRKHKKYTQLLAHPRPPLTPPSPPPAKGAMSALTHTTLRGHPSQPMRIMWKDFKRKSGTILHVCPLPTTLQPRDVWDAFSTFGKLSALEVPLSDTDPTQIKGFAYVHFESAGTAEEAAKAFYGGVDFMGTFIQAEVYKDPTAREQKCTTVCVRNIPLCWTKEHLMEQFACFGVVTSADLQEPLPGTTPDSRSGFVKFATQGGADAAIEGMKDKDVLEVPAVPQASVEDSEAAAAAAFAVAAAAAFAAAVGSAFAAAASHSSAMSAATGHTPLPVAAAAGEPAAAAAGEPAAAAAGEPAAVAAGEPAAAAAATAAHTPAAAAALPGMPAVFAEAVEGATAAAPDGALVFVCAPGDSVPAEACVEEAATPTPTPAPAPRTRRLEVFGHTHVGSATDSCVSATEAICSARARALSWGVQSGLPTSFARLSSSLRPQDAICAFAGGALPHTILSCCHGTLLGMFDTQAVLPLRATCSDALAAVAAHPWEDMGTEILGSFAHWRACFPSARCGNVHWFDWSLGVARSAPATEEDFDHLSGLWGLSLRTGT